MEWYLAVLKNYAGFGGRARRKEYWMFALFNIIFSIVLAIIDYALGIGFLGTIYALATLIKHQLHEHFFTDILFLYPLPAEPDRHLDEEGSDYRRCQMSTLGQCLEGGGKLRVVNLEGEFRTEGVLLLVFLDLLTPRDWYLFEEALLPPR